MRVHVKAKLIEVKERFRSVRQELKDAKKVNERTRKKRYLRLQRELMLIRYPDTGEMIISALDALGSMTELNECPSAVLDKYKTTFWYYYGIIIDEDL